MMPDGCYTTSFSCMSPLGIILIAVWCLGQGVVEAEVFENERFLPFRGWGHEWPGHLLPTDRVGHWSLRGDRPNGAESMDFHRVAPGLPQVSLPDPTILYHCTSALSLKN